MAHYPIGGFRVCVCLMKLNSNFVIIYKLKTDLDIFHLVACVQVIWHKNFFAELTKNQQVFNYCWRKMLYPCQFDIFQHLAKSTTLKLENDEVRVC